MKKINYLAVSFLAAAFGFASCDDKNDCGCDCNQPIIDRIELTDGGIDSISGNKINLIDSTVSGGQTIAVFGENLGGIKSVSFVGEKTGSKKDVVLKPAFITDNVIVYTVPDLDEDCRAYYYTAACPTGYALAPIAKVAPAKITMVLNEFANDKDTLKMKGSGFIGDVEVFFTNKDGEDIKAEFNKISKEEIHAIIPEGIGEGYTVKVKNVAGMSEPSFKLRDVSNILIDFDNNIDFAFGKGSEDKHPDLFQNGGNRSYKGGDYGVFDKVTDWQIVAYQPGLATSGETPEYETVFGPYQKEIEAGNYGFCDFAVKFEIFIAESNPIQGEVYTIGFTDGKDKEVGNMRRFAAFFFPCKVEWDKTGADGWKPAEIKPYFTGEWMTVSVPMSEFLWNAENRNAYTSPENNCANEDAAWGNAQRRPYCSVFEFFDEENWNGITISLNEYDCGGHYTKNGYMAIDNLRIVPDDGNGAYYRKGDWGDPVRHYFDAPIK